MASATTGWRRSAVAITKPSTWRAISASSRCRSRAGSPSVDATSAVYPAESSTRSMPRMMGGNSGFSRSGISTPTVNVRRVFSPRAIGFSE